MAQLTDTEVEIAVGEQGGYETLPARSTEERVAMQQAGFPADYDEQTVEPVVTAPAPAPALAPQGEPEARNITVTTENYDKAKQVLFSLPPESPQAKQLYGALREFKDGVEANENFYNRLDTTPTEAAPLEVYQPQMPGIAGGLPMIDEAVRPEQGDGSDQVAFQNAAGAGYDVSTGVSTSLSIKMGLLQDNPAAARATLEDNVHMALDKAGITLPPGTPAVFKDEFTGGSAYMRPYQDEQGEWRIKPTLVRAQGDNWSAGDAIEGIDMAVEIGAEFGGALATGVITKNPTLMMVGSAASAGAANYWTTSARIAVAKAMGVPEEIAETATDQQMRDALTTAGFSLGVPMLMNTIRGTANLFKALDPKDPKAIAELQKRVNTASATVKELEKRTGLNFRVSTAELTGDPELLVEQAASRRRIVGKHAKQGSVDDVHNDMETANAVRVLNNQVATANPHMVSPEAVSQRAQQTVREPIEAADGMLKDSEEALTSTMERADSVYNQGAYRGLQDDLGEVRKGAKENEGNKWDHFREVIGVSNRTGKANLHLVNGPQSPIRAIINKKGYDSQEALSRSLWQARETFINDLGAVEAGSKLRGKPTGDFLMAETLDTRQVHTLLSHLKHQKAQIDEGVSTLGWKGTDLGDVITAIETQMEKNPYFDVAKGQLVGKDVAKEIRGSFREANEATRFRHAVTETDTVREILETRNGEFYNEPGNIRALLFKPNDARQLADVRRAFGKDATKDAVMAKELETVYRSTVFKDGKFTRAGHEKFMNDYQDHMKMLFGEEGSSLVTNAAGLSGQVKRLEEVGKSTKRAMEATYGKRLADDKLYAGNVARDALNGELAPKQIAALQRRLRGVDGGDMLWENIQRNGLDALEDEVLKDAGRSGNAAAINKILTHHPDRLEALYGKQWVGDITMLRDTMRLLESGKGAASIRRDVQPTWLAVSRSFLGALSPAQRKLTAGNRWFKKAQDKRVASLLKDPAKLRKLIKYSKLKPTDIGRINAFAEIPFAQLTPQDQEARDGKNVDPRWGPI